MTPKEAAATIPLKKIKGRVNANGYTFIPYAKDFLGRKYLCLYYDGELVRMIDYAYWHRTIKGFPHLSDEHRLMFMIDVETY